ncbi:MAG: diguanylate cyclase, partial [Acidimicrobiales bacterium]
GVGHAWRLKMAAGWVDARHMIEAVTAEPGPLPVGRDHRPRRLVDRTLFSDRLQRAVRRNAGVPGGLAVLAVAPDPRAFDYTDDTSAKRAEVSLVTAGRLVGCLHYSSFVTRVAPDEFLVLAEGIGGVERAVVLADQLLAAIRRPEMAGDGTPVTASIGIAFQVPGATAEQLQNNAAVAMYSAQSGGGDRCQVYEERTQETARVVTGVG